MLWCLAMKSAADPRLSALTPIKTGTRAEMIDLAAKSYGAVWWPKGRGEDVEDVRFTNDGTERAGSFVKGASLAIVPVAMLPKAKRRAAA